MRCEGEQGRRGETTAPGEDSEGGTEPLGLGAPKSPSMNNPPVTTELVAAVLWGSSFWGRGRWRARGYTDSCSPELTPCGSRSCGSSSVGAVTEGGEGKREPGDNTPRRGVFKNFLSLCYGT